MHASLLAKHFTCVLPTPCSVFLCLPPFFPTRQQDQVQEEQATAKMIRGTMMQLAAAAGGGPQQQQQQQAAGESGGNALQAAPANGSSGAGGSIKNLGVVGRGTKRINLQPVQVNY
jgi:hypothetical protein